MNKKRIVFTVLVLLLVLMPLILAAENSTDTSLSPEDKARECLQTKLADTTCSDLNFEEKVYTVLATGDCISELKADSDDGKCWPKDNCNVLDTSKAVVALQHVFDDGVDDAKEWLIAQNMTTGNTLNWFLQIESTSPTTCTIDYDGSSHAISIGEDRKISSGAGSCLGLTPDAYWLSISSDCYDKQFNITCDQSFLTSTFFQTAGSQVIHLSRETNEESANGEITETISSYCFKASEGSNTCDYDSSLWATLALTGTTYETKAFIPYLVANVDTSASAGILSEAFLYYMTSDYEEELLQKQKSDSYWDASGDRLFDTSLAISVFGTSNSKVTDAVEWVVSKQGTEGCWNDGIRDTAMVLHFLWPQRHLSDGSEIEETCVDSGYSCTTDAECDTADILDSSEFFCSNTYRVCCKSSGEEELSCKDQGGTLCSSENEQCEGSSDVRDFADYSYTKICCLSSCEEKEEEEGGDHFCEDQTGYYCLSSCGDGYTESYDYECSDVTKYCCVEESGGSLWWLWLLILLIILVVLGIVFRDRLQPYYDEHVQPLVIKIKNKFGKGGSPSVNAGQRSPMGRRPMPGRMPMRSGPRAILPPSGQRRPPTQGSPKPRSNNDIDDVLNKLRDMGK